MEQKDTIKYSDLTAEQKVVLHLAKKGFLTSTGDITRALRDPEYAIYLITDIPEGNDDCEHIALTTDEIQVVFDNDYQ